MLFNEDNVELHLKKILEDGFLVLPEPALQEKEIATAHMPHVHNAWELKIFDNTDDHDRPYTVFYAAPGIVHASTMECSCWPLEISHHRLRIGHMNSSHCKYYTLDDDFRSLNIIPELLQALTKIQDVERFATTRFKLMTAILEHLLRLLDLLSVNNLASSRNSPMENALDYIRSNYFNPDVGVEDIARYAGVSPQYLNRVFSRETRKTTRQMLIEMRLAKAKELLDEKKYFIKDIARLTGWRCPFYFSNCFSKYYGISPSQTHIE